MKNLTCSVLYGILLAPCLLLCSVPAQAANRVFLNGAEITGVRDQTFTGATVRIDRNGDIFIEAASHSVMPASKAAAKTDAGGPNASLSQRYYLVTQPSAKAPQCELKINVNGEEKRTVRPGASPQLIMEISAWLHAGDNEIHVTGPWCNGQLLPGATPARLIIGRGHEENKVVKVDTILLSVSVGTATHWPISERKLLLAQ
ncbi:MAG: hypothetical protein MUC50_00125 [Myxococcota bacterium]|jgi:hypothetical protein|nr:hypothetical protein [Myxococcota bacterium]